MGKKSSLESGALPLRAKILKKSAPTARLSHEVEGTGMRTIMGALVLGLVAVTPAHAQMSVVPKDTSKPPPETAPSLQSANYILPFCVGDQEVPPNRNYAMQGYCEGIIYALGMALWNRNVCAPQGVIVDQERRVVVRYISARPERMHEYFVYLAAEALMDAWPCKPPPN